MCAAQKKQRNNDIEQRGARWKFSNKKLVDQPIVK